jgi:UDP-4-amino-4,6-dideoxy-N-acetyl-beta-L-altrosamine N-acetyltransferase
MTALDFSLRPVFEGDLELLYDWRNRPKVREFMYTSAVIEPAAHGRWFTSMLSDPAQQWLIMSIKGSECAVIYFTDVQEGQSCSWGFYSGPSAPAGVSLIIELAGLSYAFEKLGVRRLHFEVLSGNQQVINLHRKAGFTQEGCLRQARKTPRGQEDVIIFGMLDQEWPAARDCLQARAAKLFNPPPVSQAYESGLRRITILSDASSWINEYLDDLVVDLEVRGYRVRQIHHPADLASGDVCLLLSCGRLLNPEQLVLHRHNLVVHESALPQGQGWSPMTWQILEGASQIPVTLFEATAALDAGPIYLQRMIALNGTELVDEWRALQAEASIALCLEWLDRSIEVIAQSRPQQGEASHYRRRRPADSQLAPQRSLAEQFNLLRVVDNQRYPAYVEMQGRRYELQIQTAPIRFSKPPRPPLP